MDMNQYMDIFIEESKDHLQSMNQLLLKLEATTDDLSILNEIFRIAHTLKGMSGTMGYMKMAHLTHEMENVLQSIRNQEIQLQEYIVDILFECFDTLEEYVNELVKNGVEGDLDPNPLIKKLSDIMNNNGTSQEASIEVSLDEVAATIDIGDSFSIELEDITSKTVRKATESDFNSFRIKVVLNPNCMLKSARAFIVFNTLEKFGDIIKSKPSAEEIEDEKFDNSFEVIFITKLDEKTTKNEIESISEINEVLIQKVESQIEIDEIEETQEVKATEDNGRIEGGQKSTSEAPKAKKTKSKTSKTVRVDIDRLDNLMNLVSELIIIKTRLEDIEDSKINSNMNDAVEYLERITTSLHDAVMKVRMVPIERVFNRI